MNLFSTEITVVHDLRENIRWLYRSVQQPGHDSIQVTTLKSFVAQASGQTYKGQGKSTYPLSANANILSVSAA